MNLAELDLSVFPFNCANWELEIRAYRFHLLIYLLAMAYFANLSPYTNITLALASLAASASAAMARCSWTGSRTSLLNNITFLIL